MTANDRIELLRDAVDRLGSQAKVGRVIGYSASTISQVLSGKYIDAPEAMLAKVEECFGRDIVDCPKLGEIPFNRCVTERRREFTNANYFAVQLFRACRRCQFNTDITTL